MIGPDSLRLGSWGAQALDGLEPADGEPVLIRSRMSCFNEPMLDTLLRNLGVTDVLVAGVWTNIAVEHTVRDSADHGTRPRPRHRRHLESECRVAERSRVLRADQHHGVRPYGGRRHANSVGMIAAWYEAGCVVGEDGCELELPDMTANCRCQSAPKEGRPSQ